MALKLNFKDSELGKNLDTMDEKLKVVLKMYMSNKALELQEKMKVNRPWTDQTGRAKASLSGSFSVIDNETYRITLAHGVSYGIWLELANEKNYAIIGPTITEEGPKIVDGLGNLMAKLV